MNSQSLVITPSKILKGWDWKESNLRPYESLDLQGLQG